MARGEKTALRGNIEAGLLVVQKYDLPEAADMKETPYARVLGMVEEYRWMGRGVKYLHF